MADLQPFTPPPFHPPRRRSTGWITISLFSASLAIASLVQAADATWQAPGGGSYYTGSNWTGGTAPNGATSIATFSNAGGGTVSINGGVTLQGIVFDGSASAYTIAPSSGFHLTLAGGGASIGTTGTGAHAQLITANVFRNGPSTFTNNYASASHTLSFSGSILGNVNTGHGQYNLLTLNGSNTGANTISGAIGGGVGVSALTKSGAGTWVLSGTNTYQGPTSIEGGTLLVTGTHQAGSGTYTLAGGALGGAGGSITAAGITLGSTSGSGLNISGIGLGTTGSQNALMTPGVLGINTGTLDISQAGAGSLKFALTTEEGSDQVQLHSGTLQIGSGILNLSHFDFDLSNWESTGAEGTYVLFGTASQEAILGSLAEENLSAIFGDYRLTLALGSDSSNFDTLELEVTAVPEPSALGFLLLGALASLGWRRYGIRR